MLGGGVASAGHRSGRAAESMRRPLTAATWGPAHIPLYRTAGMWGSPSAHIEISRLRRGGQLSESAAAQLHAHVMRIRTTLVRLFYAALSRDSF